MASSSPMIQRKAAGAATCAGKARDGVNSPAPGFLLRQIQCHNGRGLEREYDDQCPNSLCDLSGLFLPLNLPCSVGYYRRRHHSSAWCGNGLKRTRERAKRSTELDGLYLSLPIIMKPNALPACLGAVFKTRP